MAPSCTTPRLLVNPLHDPTSTDLGSYEAFPITSHLVDSLLVYARDYNLPVMIEGGHPRVSEASQIAELARRFPQVTMIVAHAGQLNISGRGLFDAARLFTAHPNTTTLG